MISRSRVDPATGLPSLAPLPMPPVGREAISAAWEAACCLLEGVLGRGRVTLIVNDCTRPQVAGRILAPAAGALEGRCRILVATGTHRDVTEAEKSRQLGGLLAGSEWRCTRAEGAAGIPLGTTALGTEVVLDEWVAGAGALVIVNTVEPHYFAGFTGGRKSLLPGCASRRTVLQNHFLACRPGSLPAVLEGNPVHEDMAEAAAMVSRSVPVLLASGVVQGGELVQFCVGGLVEAFEESVRVSRRASCVPVDRRRAVVVARPGSPLDMNLYQAMKAVYNCGEAVEDGGILILDAHCTEGLGADHMEASLGAVLDPSWEPPTREGYGLGDHSTVRLKRMRERIRLGLHSLLPEDLVRRLGFEWIESLEGIPACSGPVVLEDAGTAVPVLEGGR